MNPSCKQTVEWLSHRGRPPSFCSPNCSKVTHRSAQSLARKLEAVNAELELQEVDRRRQLESEVARLTWQLQRYAGAILPPDHVAQLFLRKLQQGTS